MPSCASGGKLDKKKIPPTKKRTAIIDSATCPTYKKPGQGEKKKKKGKKRGSAKTRERNSLDLALSCKNPERKKKKGGMQSFSSKSAVREVQKKGRGEKRTTQRLQEVEGKNRP